MAPIFTITDVTYITVTAGALPSEPSIKLNTMEAQWILVLLQHLLLFEGDHLPPFDNILHSLRSSLVTTLAIHIRLIGKLYYLADISDVVVCYSIGCGGDNDCVKFVATQYDTNVRRLAGDNHDVLTFVRLVPEPNMSLRLGLLLTMQTTRLAVAGGRVAFRVSVEREPCRQQWPLPMKLTCSFFLILWIKAHCYFIVLAG
jgi:hypothetical protein